MIDKEPVIRVGIRLAVRKDNREGKATVIGGAIRNEHPNVSRLAGVHMNFVVRYGDLHGPAVSVYGSKPAALRSCVILSTAVSTSSGFRAPVQTSFPLPKRSTTTFGESSR